MAKIDKELDNPKVSTVRKTDPPPNRHYGKGRGKNFEASDAAVREKIELHKQRYGTMYTSYLESSLPENIGKNKKERAIMKRVLCECGHRGLKHARWWSFMRPKLVERVGGPCEVCRREDDGCQKLNPKNAVWMSPCSAHQNPENDCAACDIGFWELGETAF